MLLSAEGAEPAGTEATARLVQGGAESAGSMHMAGLWPLAAAAAADGDSTTLRSVCDASQRFAWALPSRRAGEPFVRAGGSLTPTRCWLALPAPGHLPALASLARPSWLSRAFRGLPLGEGSRRSPLHAAASAGRWVECTTLAASLLPSGSGAGSENGVDSDTTGIPTTAEASQAAVLLLRGLASRDARGATPLLLAAARGNARTLLALLTLAAAAEADLSQAQINPQPRLSEILNYGDARGFTPLHYCAMRASHGEFGAKEVAQAPIGDGAGYKLAGVPWTLMYRLLQEAGADP